MDGEKNGQQDSLALFYYSYLSAFVFTPCIVKHVVTCVNASVVASLHSHPYQLLFRMILGLISA